jgi:hypothetical protein
MRFESRVAVVISLFIVAGMQSKVEKVSEGDRPF